MRLSKPGMLFPLISLIFWLCTNVSTAQNTLSSPMGAQHRESLDGCWRFKYYPSPANMGKDSMFFRPDFDTHDWAKIKVPGNWEMQGFADPAYGKKLVSGTGLYSRNFTVPENWKDDSLYLCFDGVNFGYALWVNGGYVGQFASSFNQHIFNVSKFIKPGQLNSVAVKVITHPRGWEFDTNDDWSLSGISRSVTLFGLPGTHIADVLIKTEIGPGSGAVHIGATLMNVPERRMHRTLRLKGTLLDPAGKTAGTYEIPVTSTADRAGLLHLDKILKVKNPQLWSAETPFLYTLRLRLTDGDRVLQQYVCAVGIREIAWAGGVLKVNGMPVKLKGVTHHDLSPLNGRSITDEELRTDLKLMKEANINFVRTSHYPPRRKLLDLCDSMGLYVMDEVPFGYGDELLRDTTYLPVLLNRARSTIQRDKNHPSILIWSVGNENPVTQIGLQTGRYVKRLDNTRPYCFPQTPTVFKNMFKALPDSIDILDYHYPKSADLDSLNPMLKQPIVASEYAHALGLDFGDMEDIYETMYAHPKMAGGAVWEFFDQGLLRKAPKSINAGDPTIYVWKSKDSIYDTGETQGTDGVVYADRTPQEDYYQVRKVYTPVMALDDTFHFASGPQSFNIKLINRYDFKNLSSLTCDWKLYGDTAILHGGSITLSCLPHDTTEIYIKADLPTALTASFYYLKLSFRDQARQEVYEKTYVINTDQAPLFINRLGNKGNGPVTRNQYLISSKSFQCAFMPDSGQVVLKNSAGDVIISGGPFARVGRKPTLAEDATTTSRRSKILHTLWGPYILKPDAAKCQFAGDHKVVCNNIYKPESPEGVAMAGKVAYDFTDGGIIHVTYVLTPSGSGSATEAGLSFLVPKSLTEFRWVGKGPFAAYPGKNRLSEFGIYHLNSSDLYFAGNREFVQCAVFSDGRGNGFAIIGDAADISVERTKDGLLVSHNAWVAARFNKYEWPRDLYDFKNGVDINGRFSIVPLTAGNWPSVLKKLFGAGKGTAKAFHPFYNSYDQ